MQLIPFLALSGVFIAFCYLKFGGKSSKGMNLIFEVGHGEEEVIPIRLIPFIISGTWITHLFGGSAGREGVAVQIGATFPIAGKKIPLKNSSHIFLVTGMAAGFAGLFQTPLAAVFFAMEVLVAGALEYQALLPAVTAAFTASMTSHFLGLEKFSFALTAEMNLNLPDMGKADPGRDSVWNSGRGFCLGAEIYKSETRQDLEPAGYPYLLYGTYNKHAAAFTLPGRYAGLGTNLNPYKFYGGEIYSLIGSEIYANNL